MTKSRMTKRWVGPFEGLAGCVGGALLIASCTTIQELPGQAPPSELAASASAPLKTARGSKPKLVVLVHVDSFRADYLTRFEPLLGDGGLKRLMREGSFVREARVSHTVSLPAPGVASVTTGVLPGRAGIPSSRWFDRTRRKSLGAVDDERSFTRGSDPEILKSEYSPRALERPTLGGLMKQQFGPTALVASISWYAETALLLGGRESDASLWLDPETGTWVTSSQVMNALPDFALDENRAGALHKYRGETWERSFSDEVGRRYASADDDPDEPPFAGMPHFPYEIPVYVMVRNKVRKVADATPFNDLTVMDLVKRAVPGMGLGADETPDLLCIDFSALGDAGQDYGPDSQEVMDVFLRLDRRVAELLSLLDEELGRGDWALALTSTQGIARLPEKTGGQRLRSHDIQVPVELGLRQAYPQHVVRSSASWSVGLGGPWLFLSHSVAAEAGVELAELRARAAEIAAEIPGIESAWTPEQLLEANDPQLRRWAADLHPERSGDVLLLMEAGCVLNAGVGTAAGSHHESDRLVPLFLMGPGIRAGHEAARGEPLDVLPTLAGSLGLALPDDLDGRALPGALVDD